MPREKREMKVMSGTEQDRQKMLKSVEKIKERALKELQASDTEGFALFFIRNKGRKHGVQQIIGGALGVQDTILLTEAMHSLSEEMLNDLMQGLGEELLNGRK